MRALEEEVRRRLFELQDLKYKEFACKLMPTVNPETVIGVRTPELRKLTRTLRKNQSLADIRPEEYYVNMMIAWYSLKNNSLLFVPPATAAEWRFICLLRK